MNMSNEQMHEWVELYNLDLLEGDDKIAFEQELMTNATLRKMLSEQKAFMRLVSHKTSKEFVANQLDMIRKDQSHMVRRIADSMQVHVSKYWKTASVAASVALVASILTFQFAKNGYDKKLNSVVNLLNKHDKDLKNNTKQINSINNKIATKIPETEFGNSKQAGTCFVLKNNGYVITNAHVVNGFEKIYVFTNDNVGHKATIVKLDAASDLALLKIEESNFSFGKMPLPYGINHKQNGMSAKVYTLGFPKSTIVYNEGYISSVFGRNDDSNHYEMELPSSPGVSGSPVFDDKGNITAIINSKESIGNSTTYALKSGELKKFLSTIDSVNFNSMNQVGSLKRDAQVKAIEPFVLEVKVY
jgi:serine protease Do